MGEYLDVVHLFVVHHDVLVGAHTVRTHCFQHVVKVTPNISCLACEFVHVGYAYADSLFVCLFRLLTIVLFFFGIHTHRLAPGMGLLVRELSEVINMGSLLGICRRFPVFGQGFLDQTPNTLELFKEEFPYCFGIGVVAFDLIFLSNLFHQQVEKPGVPFAPQGVLIPVGHVRLPRTGAGPINLEPQNIVLACWFQFQEVPVPVDAEELLDMGTTKSLQNGMSACGLNMELKVIKLTRASVLPTSRDLSTGTLKTREIAGEDLGERPVLCVIRPLDIIVHNIPT